MNTPYFSALQARTQELVERFLPSKPEPLGDYSVGQIDGASAFVLLMHSELESYVEKLSIGIAESLVDRIKAGHFDELTSVFLMHSARELNKWMPTPLDVAKAGNGKIRRTIRGNNGIKSEDFKKLLGPFGIYDAQIGTDLSSELDSFGSKRGGIAHTGLEVGIARSINPYEERANAMHLLRLLGAFDESVASLIPELDSGTHPHPCP